MTNGTRRGWGVSVTPRPLYPRERPGTHCTGGWVGPRAGLDRCGKSRPPPGFDTRTVRPVASRYTDWATPVHAIIYAYFFKTTYVDRNQGDEQQWKDAVNGRTDGVVQPSWAANSPDLSTGTDRFLLKGSSPQSHNRHSDWVRSVQFTALTSNFNLQPILLLL